MRITTVHDTTHTCQAYQALTEKHTALASELRRLTEERGDSIAAGSEELLRARHEVAQLTCKYEAICANASDIRCAAVKWAQ